MGYSLFLVKRTAVRQGRRGKFGVFTPQIRRVWSPITACLVTNYGVFGFPFSTKRVAS